MLRLLVRLGYACLFVWVTACNPKETPPPTDIGNLQSALDHLILEDEFHVLFDMADNIVRTTSIEDSELSACARVFDLGSPFVLFADTATNGMLDIKKPCLCRDFLYRRGRFYVSTDGNYPATGSKLYVSLQDYYAGARADSSALLGFSGRLEATVLTRTADTMRYQIKVLDGACTFPNGTGPHNWNTERILTRFSGNLTTTTIDDKYRVTGSSKGLNRSGKAFTANIVSPIEKDFTQCLVANGRGRFIKGRWTVTDENGEATANFDIDTKATCDRLVRLSLDRLLQDLEIRPAQP